MTIDINKNKSITNSLDLGLFEIVDSKGIITEGPRISSAGPTSGYMNNFPKYIWRLLYESKKSQDILSLAGIVTKNGDAFTLISISYTKRVAEVFEPLVKMGVHVTELQIGINKNLDTLWVPQDVITTVKRFGDAVEIQLYAYLFNLAYTLRYMFTNKGAYMGTYDRDKVALNESVVNAPNDYFYQFTDSEKYIQINAIKDEQLTSYSLFKSPYHADKTPTSTFLEASTYIYLEDAKDESKHCVIDVFPGAKSPFYYIFNNTESCTNEPFTLSFANTYLNTFLRLLTSKRSTKSYTWQEVSVINPSAFEKRDVYIKAGATDLSPATSVPFFIDVEDILKSPAVNLTVMANTKTLEETLKIKVVGKVGIVDSSAVSETYADDEYAQELYKQVMPYYDTFNLKTLNNILKGYIKGDIYSMFFIGDSGTGKSTAARVIPSRCGFPYVIVNFSVNIEEADMFGSMIPNPFKKSADDPEFIWEDGIVTKAVRRGYTCILEELNFARPGVLAKFNSLLDESRQIDLLNGEVLKAHPNFRVIATSNISYEGTNRLNKALINRFEIVHEFTDLDYEEILEIIKTRTGYTDTVKIQAVYKVYSEIKKFAKEQNLDVVVSLRQLLAIFTKGGSFANLHDAIVALMVNGVFLEEPLYKKDFMIVLNAMKLKTIKF